MTSTESKSVALSSLSFIVNVIDSEPFQFWTVFVKVTPNPFISTEIYGFGVGVKVKEFPISMSPINGVKSS